LDGLRISLGVLLRVRPDLALIRKRRQVTPRLSNEHLAGGERRYQHLSIEEAGEQADWSAEDSATDDDEEQLAIMRRGIAEALTARQREAIEAALGGLPLMELARR
jgi:hypothetical protein